MFEDYFTYDAILFRLCKARAKLARQRGKSHLNHIISADNKYNYHYNNPNATIHKGNEVDLLCSLMPPRRKWKNPTKKERYPKRTIQRINSLEFNTLALLKTIAYYQKKAPTEPFLVRLNAFIAEIISDINNARFVINPPQIQPKLKKPDKKSDKTCRPICVFPLKEKIIISIANKYLTKSFDDYFYDHSYAFRAKKDGEKLPPTHHSAIEHLLKYKSKYKGKRLWVSECDISKFFDTVNHTVVRKEFYRLVKQFNKNNATSIDWRAINIFESYLNCFDFQKMVLSLNDNDEYWNNHKNKDGQFEWVEEELKALGCYKKINRNKIGIPQGGALSGLIANIVLNSIDKRVADLTDKKLCYIRFCDDMLLLHPNRKICQEKSDLYFNSLKKLKLISHSPDTVSSRNKFDFWNKSKSKSPYKWSNDSINSFKIIGFVGYEISYNGTLRVRKSSLIKERRKISKLISDTLIVLKNGKRKSDNMILESVCNKLIGMSVGRVTMKNYNTGDNEMCWVNGFTLLNDNQLLRAQLRRLDRHRSRKVAYFKRKLETIGNSGQNIIEKKKINKSFFISIRGINNRDSEEIRLELQRLGVLSSRFYLTKSKRNILETNPGSIVLSTKYKPYLSEIINILLEDSTDDRYVPYYGKPFSYFYNVIEKGE